MARPSLELYNNFITGNFLSLSLSSASSSPSVSREGWFLDLEGGADNKEMKLPEIVKVGDPVLREHAQEVDPFEIRSERVQKIRDDIFCVMRKADGISLSAPQIGIPLRIIVLKNEKAYTSYAPKEVIIAQERKPFDQLVILNPKLEKKSNMIGYFLESCFSVGFKVAVKRS